MFVLMSLFLLLDYEWVNTLPKMVSANGSEVGYCEIDDEFVNPLNLTIREAGSGSKSFSSSPSLSSTL